MIIIKRILMNKNTKVLQADFDTATSGFTDIIEIYNMDYAPYILKNIYENKDNDTNFLRASLSSWFKGRGIPSWRDKLDLLMHRLNINAPYELLDKAFGLSLSDQYWLKPLDTNLTYADVNFFDNDFDYASFLDASLSKNSRVIYDNSSLKTPNNITDGMLKKAWIIENNIRYLLKGGYKNESLQPFNEVLASQICKRLGLITLLRLIKI